MLNRLIVIALLIIQSGIVTAQDIPIGEWRDHLPYTDAVSVSYGNGLVYCATNSTVFIYDKSDQTIERLNLVSGLSDIGLSKIKFNDYNNRVVIAYTNGNIDVIDENKNITNLSFIKNSNIIGDKSINHIYIVGKLAYLSTGFGIVVLDTDKLEIADTYLFGPLGSYVVTNSVTMDNNNIYAATEQGVFFANKNNPNLTDYNVWSQIPELGNFNYVDILYYSGRLFTCLETVAAGDTIFFNDTGIWQKFLPYAVNFENMYLLNGNIMAFVWGDGISYVEPGLSTFLTFYSYNFTISAAPKEVFIDNEDNHWIADNKLGLVKMKNNFSEFIVPNGPSSSNTFKMDFLDGELWIASGGYGIALSNNIINHWSNNSWSVIPSTMQNAQGNNIADIVSVAINPSNPNNVYAGSWSSGLLELNNGSLTQIFNASNSALDSLGGLTVTGPLKFDADNNLWVVNSFTNNILAAKTPDNNWHSFSFPGKTSPLDEFHEMIIDQNNFKWILNNTEDNIIVFNDMGTLGVTGDDQSKVLTASINNIPGAKLHSIAEDLDGEIWIGTDEGVAVFYNPSAVFDENIKAEQIFIQQDGQTQILLETEIVTTIEIDGANRKWIGTQNSGVFLMSEDGTEQIEHFTTENSPLFSDNIFDIAINPKTGEVFFGTQKGLISYKGTATDGNEDFSNVFVYPNPVKPDFNGTIAIRGLMKDTDVRITDISGNIVYQTTSLGGQAIWDGKDFNGNKVQTGVYMVFNGSPKGELKAAAKILFIH